MKISEVKEILKNEKYETLYKPIGNDPKLQAFVKYFCPECKTETIKRISGFKTVLCETCARRRTALKMRLTEEDIKPVIDTLKENGAEFVELYFRFLKNKKYSTPYIKYKCPCSALVDTRLSLFKNDKKHPCLCVKCASLKCQKRKKYLDTTKEKLRIALSNSSAVLIKLSKRVVQFICKCGEKAQVFYRHTEKQVFRCKKCVSTYRKNINPKNRTSLREVRKFFIDRGCFPLFFKYKKHTQKLPFICVCGNIDFYRLDTSYTNKKSTPKCKICLVKENSREKSPNFNKDLSSLDRYNRLKHTRPPETNTWRRAVFKRDSYTCQITGVKGLRLEAHHLYNWSNNPDKRYDLDNGITLSKEIHDLFHKLYGKKNTTPEMFFEFRQKYITGKLK